MFSLSFLYLYHYLLLWYSSITASDRGVCAFCEPGDVFIAYPAAMGERVTPRGDQFRSDASASHVDIATLPSQGAIGQPTPASFAPALRVHSITVSQCLLWMFMIPFLLLICVKQLESVI